MKSEPAAQLSDELARAIGEERAREALPAGMHDRLLASIEAAVAGPGGGSNGGPSDANATDPEGPAAPPDVASALTSSPLLSGAIFCAGLVLGGGLGFVAAGEHAQPPGRPPTAVAEPAEEASTVPEPAEPTPVAAAPIDDDPPVSAAPPIPTSAPVSAAPSVPTSPPGRTPRRTPRQAEVDPSTLEAERTLVDAARSALAWGTPADAIAALDRHHARFPRGVLAEEREGLRVIALCRVDPARARAAATRFHRRYPASVLRGAIDRALAAEREPTHETSPSE